MKVHELKLQQPFFNHVFYNQKEFEVRKDDRDFKVGDRLKFLEFPYVVRQRFVLKDIKYILKGGQFGIEKGFVVLGLKEISQRQSFSQILEDEKFMNIFKQGKV